MRWPPRDRRGSPRRRELLDRRQPASGTTLVQRLACEIPGVRMPPETHFFTRASPPTSSPTSDSRSRGTNLAAVVRRFAEAEHSGGLEVDVEGVLTELGGICERPYDLFEALVRQLAGPADVWGEKTPNHLVWWRPISRAAPWMRFVAVVRDPRAVVASNLEMPWRTDRTLPAWGDHMHLAFAELWAFLQAQVTELSTELGPERCLVLRYEDVVKDPPATRALLARFLGLSVEGPPQEAPADIVLPWESWKARALDPVTDDRVGSWREQLDPRQANDIALVCRRTMGAFGYHTDLPSWPPVAARWARLGPTSLVRLARLARGRRHHLHRVERYRL